MRNNVTDNDKRRMLSRDIFKKLLLIREVELKIVHDYPTDKIKSPIHTSIGQEFVSVGVCEALQESDVVFGTYRGHALYLAKGGNLEQMIAELYGKKGGCAGGKAGSMHLIDRNVGMMGTSAIVAASIPHAVGFAMAMKYRKQEGIVACFFGEGATDEGVFYEAVNFAVLKKLPILFVCENNGYAIYSKQEARSAGLTLSEKVNAFGVESRKITDGEIVSAFSAATEAVNKVRGGDGPYFLEIDTCRWYDHVGPKEDWTMGYRSKNDAQRWIEQDQVEVVGQSISSQDRKDVEEEVKVMIARAFEYAENQVFPGEEDLLTNVYA